MKPIIKVESSNPKRRMNLDIREIKTIFDALLENAPELFQEEAPRDIIILPLSENIFQNAILTEGEREDSLEERESLTEEEEEKIENARKLIGWLFKLSQGEDFSYENENGTYFIGLSSIKNKKEGYSFFIPTFFWVEGINNRLLKAIGKFFSVNLTSLADFTLFCLKDEKLNHFVKTKINGTISILGNVEEKEKGAFPSIREIFTQGKDKIISLCDEVNSFLYDNIEDIYGTCVHLASRKINENFSIPYIPTSVSLSLISNAIRATVFSAIKILNLGNLQSVIKTYISPILDALKLISEEARQFYLVEKALEKMDFPDDLNNSLHDALESEKIISVIELLDDRRKQMEKNEKCLEKAIREHEKLASSNEIVRNKVAEIRILFHDFIETVGRRIKTVLWPLKALKYVFPEWINSIEENVDESIREVKNQIGGEISQEGCLELIGLEKELIGKVEEQLISNKLKEKLERRKMEVEDARKTLRDFEQKALVEFEGKLKQFVTEKLYFSEGISGIEFFAREIRLSRELKSRPDSEKNELLKKLDKDTYYLIQDLYFRKVPEGQFRVLRDDFIKRLADFHLRQFNVIQNESGIKTETAKHIEEDKQRRAELLLDHQWLQASEANRKWVGELSKEKGLEEHDRIMIRIREGRKEIERLEQRRSLQDPIKRLEKVIEQLSEDHNDREIRKVLSILSSDSSEREQLVTDLGWSQEKVEQKEKEARRLKNARIIPLEDPTKRPYIPYKIAEFRELLKKESYQRINQLKKQKRERAKVYRVAHESYIAILERANEQDPLLAQLLSRSRESVVGKILQDYKENRQESHIYWMNSKTPAPIREFRQAKTKIQFKAVMGRMGISVFEEVGSNDINRLFAEKQLFQSLQGLKKTFPILHRQLYNQNPSVLLHLTELFRKNELNNCGSLDGFIKELRDPSLEPSEIKERMQTIGLSVEDEAVAKIFVEIQYDRLKKDGAWWIREERIADRINSALKAGALTYLKNGNSALSVADVFLSPEGSFLNRWLSGFIMSLEVPFRDDNRINFLMDIVHAERIEAVSKSYNELICSETCGYLEKMDDHKVFSELQYQRILRKTNTDKAKQLYKQLCDCRDSVINSLYKAMTREENPILTSEQVDSLIEAVTSRDLNLEDYIKPMGDLGLPHNSLEERAWLFAEAQCHRILGEHDRQVEYDEGSLCNEKDEMIRAIKKAATKKVHSVTKVNQLERLFQIMMGTLEHGPFPSSLSDVKKSMRVLGLNPEEWDEEEASVSFATMQYQRLLLCAQEEGREKLAEILKNSKDKVIIKLKEKENSGSIDKLYEAVTDSGQDGQELQSALDALDCASDNINVLYQENRQASRVFWNRLVGGVGLGILLGVVAALLVGGVIGIAAGAALFSIGTITGFFLGNNEKEQIDTLIKKGRERNKTEVQNQSFWFTVGIMKHLRADDPLDEVSLVRLFEEPQETQVQRRRRSRTEEAGGEIIFERSEPQAREKEDLDGNITSNGGFYWAVSRKFLDKHQHDFKLFPLGDSNDRDGKFYFDKTDFWDFFVKNEHQREKIDKKVRSGKIEFYRAVPDQYEAIFSCFGIQEKEEKTDRMIPQGLQ